MKDLRSKIMRRVYYTYAIRLVTHPISIHGAALGVCFIALSRAVSIPSVWVNMMDVKVGDLASFWIGALTHTRTFTLVLIGLILVTLGSLVWQLMMSGRRVPMPSFRQSSLGPTGMLSG